MGAPRMLRAATLAAAIALSGTAAAEPAGSFAMITDVHFDPFDPPGLAVDVAGLDIAEWQARVAAHEDGAPAPFGKDTNPALLVSALAAITAHTGEVDFGDWAIPRTDPGGRDAGQRARRGRPGRAGVGPARRRCRGRRR